MNEKVEQHVCPSIENVKKYRPYFALAPIGTKFRGSNKTINLRINCKVAEIAKRNGFVLREIVAVHLLSRIKNSNKLLVDLRILYANFNVKLNYGRTDETCLRVSYLPIWIKIKGSGRKIIHHGYLTFNKKYIVKSIICDCCNRIILPHINDHILHLINSD